MPCYHPIEVLVPRDVPGKRLKEHLPMTVPCGRCIGCRAIQARDWTFRILHETQIHDASWFLTLTYDEEHLPSNGSLCAKDLQRFFKALRRDLPPGQISYYACGEYGDLSQRPHYHSVLYGLDLLDKCVVRSDSSGPVWSSGTLSTYWPHGLLEFSAVTPGSASYVAGYVRKKLSKRAYPEAYTRVDPDTGELVQVEQEFSRMSLKPAIGRRWIERHWSDVYPRDFVTLKGREYKPPRYYDKWASENIPEVFLQVKLKRDAEAVVLEDDRLLAKEAVHKARSNLFLKREKV